MKRINVIVMIIGVSFLLVSCRLNDAVESYINVKETEKMLNKDKRHIQYPNVGDEDTMDFAFINGAPKTEVNHEVDDIIKMYATRSTFDELKTPIAIDIEKNEIYIEPNIHSFGVVFGERRKEVNDTYKVIDLFEKHNVLSWNHYYANVKDYHSYEDGVSWRILVQYADGTIETFRGQGTQFNEITPENYNDFMNELENYVDGHLKE